MLPRAARELKHNVYSFLTDLEHSRYHHELDDCDISIEYGEYSQYGLKGHGFSQSGDRSNIFWCLKHLEIGFDFQEIWHPTARQYENRDFLKRFRYPLFAAERFNLYPAGVRQSIKCVLLMVRFRQPNFNVHKDLIRLILTHLVSAEYEFHGAQLRNAMILRNHYSQKQQDKKYRSTYRDMAIDNFVRDSFWTTPGDKLNNHGVMALINLGLFKLNQPEWFLDHSVSRWKCLKATDDPVKHRVINFFFENGLCLSLLRKGDIKLDADYNVVDLPIARIKSQQLRERYRMDVHDFLYPDADVQNQQTKKLKYH